MNILQNILDKTLKNAFSADKLLSQIICKKLKEKGIVLSEKQLRQLQNDINSVSTNKPSIFTIDENEAIEYPLALRGQSSSVIDLKIDAEKEIEEIDCKFNEFIKDFIPNISSEIAVKLLQSLKQKFNSHHLKNSTLKKSFNQNLHNVWGKPLDLLEMLYYIALETGDIFNSHFRQSITIQNNYLFDVLIRLHARSCQITFEIILLLRNGLADGAHARWRTLHEIAIVSYFIEKHGNDLAERYYYHSSVETYKAALQFQEHCDALGHDKIPVAEFNIIKTKRDEVVNKFGTSYKESYGWASTVLGNQNPKFSDIEKNVGLEYMRPYYKMASHNVHANPKGIFFKLGLTDSDEFLLAGSSNLGLSDPGCNTAISLLQITSNMLISMETNLDSIVTIQIMTNLSNDITEAFAQAEQYIKEEMD